MPSDSWKLAPGLNNVGSYEVSGAPFCSGGINAILNAGGYKIEFPYVTRWIIIHNRSSTAAHDLKVGFSQLGVTTGTNYFTLDNKNSATSKDRGSFPPRLELKVSEIWLSGSSDVDIIAGLTNIPRQRTTTSLGTNWSGSTGVG